jgi:polyphosphate kinase
MTYPFRNKEVSWLSFNERLLQEASDHSVPLIERIRFLGIYSSNQDEFFRVRVATLYRLARLGKKGKKLLGHDPREVIAELKNIVLRQQEVFQGVYRQLVDELATEGIHLVDEASLTAEQGEFVRHYFRERVRSKLTPLMVSEKKRFPELKDKSIYLATRLRTRGSKSDRYALIEVPTPTLSRFLILPQIDARQYVILLEDVIRYNLKDIFALFKFESIESHLIKLTRDAELDIDDDVTESYLRKVVKSVKDRKEGDPVRFVYDRAISDELLYFIKRKLRLRGEDSLVPGGRTHNFKDFIDFPKIGKRSLLYPKLEPVRVPELEQGQSIMASMRKREFLLHFPYESFDYVIDLLREAAIDPKVKEIKVTLYRVARRSGVANALVNAARNGKDVTVIIELQARFDEETNIALANELQEEGAQVIFGVPGLKVHAKVGLILREEKGKLTRYAFLGTGNLNEDTGTIYSDHCLFTTDRRLTREVDAVFDFLQDNYRVPSFKHLVVAPFTFRQQMVELVQKEIDNAKNGGKAEINLKLNNLTDPDMIGLLYDAADAGVQVQLNVRGMYSLLPQTLEHQKNIEGIGIIDRLLEHTRIFVFHNGGDEKVFLSSGDWMTRNLDRRVEVTFPVYDKDLQRELKSFLDIQWRDNTKARVLDTALTNRYRPRRGTLVRAQSAFYEYIRIRSESEPEADAQALA